ncbi:winged helix-turn-helix transcriptional regulator [Paenibacillus thermoaerophilus]|uniref:Winged helix-turn-helix transcriptional regulator n=1 Tax=Paenibacillus thermoaerophilus TaxID=1215385 RepID=A0ABW2V0A8_9BACL|nr:winged helix-turn-helix transcriptional regulator [Paenibacillus thermoaerophilus]
MTEYGWSLKPILDAMCTWGEKQIELAQDRMEA